MPLSNCTIKGCISEMSNDILDQAVAEMKASPYFVLQLYESTYVASCEQLLVYAWSIKGDPMKEELLSSESLTTTAGGDNVITTLQNFFVTKGLQWTK
jgi:hypothetical protein